MGSIFELISKYPEEYQSHFIINKNGKIKISQGELLKTEYWMGALTRNADGSRIEMPVTNTDHIPRQLVSNLNSFVCIVEFIEIELSVFV